MDYKPTVTPWQAGCRGMAEKPQVTVVGLPQ